MPPPELPDWLARFESGHYRPATFIERGVALPFTTPGLLGGRIRPAQRCPAELVLANPAGVEGVYILPWSALPDLCSPTLHDRALWTAVAGLSPLTPQMVREAARGVAVQGFAGRAAARAASEAATSRSQAQLILHYRLLLELVRQLEGPGRSTPTGQGNPAEVERRALAALGRLGREGGITPAVAMETLGEMALAFEGCGLRHAAQEARLPRLAAGIAAMAQEVERWAAGAQDTARASARLLVESSELTLRCCRQAFMDAHALLDDLWTLLQRWRFGKEEILAMLARPEWLLDGWELICGLWREAPPARRAAALFDMALLVPVIPAEVRSWMGFDAAGIMDGHRAGMRRWRRMVRTNEDWISGRVLHQVARNENLRALCT